MRVKFKAQMKRSIRYALYGFALGLALILVFGAVAFRFSGETQLTPALVLLLGVGVFALLAGLAGIGASLGSKLDRFEQLTIESQQFIARSASRERKLLQENAQRHNLEKILERGKREWESIFDAVQDAILVADSHGQIIRCNLSATRWLNTTFENLVHMPIDQVVLGTPHDTSVQLTSLVGELHIPSLGGWYDFTRYPIDIDEEHRGMIYIVRDITERKRDEAIIRQQKEHLQALIHNSPVAIVTLDKDQNVLACNPAFENLFGYTPGEVIGHNLDALLNGNEVSFEAVSFSERI